MQQHDVSFRDGLPNGAVEVLTERDGTWDNLGLYDAAEALSRGARQKAAMSRAATDGVLDLM